NRRRSTLSDGKERAVGSALAGLWSGVSGRAAAEPDAVCLSGAVSEGAGAGAVGKPDSHGRERKEKAALAWLGICRGHFGIVLGACGCASEPARRRCG